jgi:hypothetical protein
VSILIVLCPVENLSIPPERCCPDYSVCCLEKEPDDIPKGVKVYNARLALIMFYNARQFLNTRTTRKTTREENNNASRKKKEKER